MKRADRNVVLLFHPRTFHHENYRNFHVPYSLLAVASGLDRRKWDVRIIDNNHVEREDFSTELEKLENRLFCVGISSMIGRQVGDGLRFAETVRNVSPEVPIVWGGALPTVLPRETVEHKLVDAVVAGQGQIGLPRLLETLATRRSLSEAGSMIRPKLVIDSAEYCQGLDPLGSFRSVYDLVQLAAYIHPDEHIDTRTISYHSSQGCPFGCGFCSETALWGRRWTGAPARQMVEDIEHLVTSVNVNGVKFYDAEFFIDPRRSLSFAEEILKRGIPIKWGAAAHPLSLSRLSDSHFELLKASGLSRVLVGAESGVEEELELIGKRSSREMLLRLAERCSQWGITASFSFVTGYPGAASRNTEATLTFAAELASAGPEHEVKIHFFAPYPRTPLYGLSLQQGFVPPSSLEDWSQYDYYRITTPWVDPIWEPVVRAFNEENCPYLGDGPTGDSPGAD